MQRASFALSFFALLLAGLAASGCVSPALAIHEPMSSWSVEYEVTGEFNSGTLLVSVHPPRSTVDALEDARLAVPVEFRALNREGEQLAHMVHWIDGTFSIVRTDELCFDAPTCSQSRVLFGSMGSPAPFGLFHGQWEDGVAFDGRQAARDFVRIQENQLAIDAPDVLQLQYFQLPNGTFSYTDLPVPATFTGMLLPYGKATATREFVARGPAFEMPEPWSAPGIASDRMHDSAFFPGDDGELLGSGASVLEAWAELLNRSQDVSPDDQECVTVVSVRNAGRADGYVGDLGEFNFTNFAFIVQAEDELGVRHSIDVNDHWVRGREWFLQEPQATVSYGQCLDREIARPAAVNLSGFLQRTKSMPLMGETRGMSASYWTDDVQPFGLPHDRLRFSKSFAVDAGWTPYVEMDAASGAWYRWFGATEAMEELGLFQPN